jgi:predicted SprT family Zn-dependent metalloprotease
MRANPAIAHKETLVAHNRHQSKLYAAPRLRVQVQNVAMNDFLFFCPTCKTIYEIVRHHVRPPAGPICELCQQDLPLADDGEWLTYLRTRPRFERTV